MATETSTQTIVWKWVEVTVETTNAVGVCRNGRFEWYVRGFRTLLSLAVCTNIAIVTSVWTGD